jgi:hypothetical protein
LLCHYSLGTILHGLAGQQEKARIINEIQWVRKPFSCCQEYFFIANFRRSPRLVPQEKAVTAAAFRPENFESTASCFPPSVLDNQLLNRPSHVIPKKTNCQPGAAAACLAKISSMMKKCHDAEQKESAAQPLSHRRRLDERSHRQDH